MIDLFIEFSWLFYFLFISTILAIVFSRDLGPFSVLVNIVAYGGVFIHELAHYSMCKILVIVFSKPFCSPKNSFEFMGATHIT